ncbi:hypothetical protein OIDMADRAFT_35785 [Oidiodendron maius Zn]|uniref:AB hydrolase-1 domain-containing protein n=1 Tax=Oidiodendron maius (strain Zn) TaxID=913774 RepID=A0A0C3GQ02_OIDMZ|nr:hypothetical protein OIDMADRAFT_35785 [Oidiodendron maius Zn]
MSRNYTYSFIFSPPRGENVWLLFLHGFPLKAHDWRHQIPFFINLGYGVVAPDLPGYGQSPKPAELEAYKAKAIYADIIEILRSRSIIKVVGVARDCDLCTRDGARLWIQQGKVTRRAKYIIAEEAKEHERLFAIENGGYQPALFWYKSMIYNINADDESKANLSAGTLIKVPVPYIRGSRDPLASGNPENEFKKLAINFSFEVFEGRHWPALEKRDSLNERLGQILIHSMINAVQPFISFSIDGPRESN